jgi:hypothetical protein
MATLARARPPAINALRVSSALLARLESTPGESGRVLSVHGSAVNIEWSTGGLMALHGEGDLRAPFAAAVPDTALGQFAAHALVRREAGVVAVGDLRLRWQGAEIVDTRMPTPERVCSTACPEPAPRAVLAAAALASRGSALDGPLGRSAQNTLAAGLARRDPACVLEGALGLMGLGPGLTPAGDDCLVGVLAVLHRVEPDGLVAAPLVRLGIEGAARTRTTTVAAEFLRHALAGRFAEPLLDLLTATNAEGGHTAARRLCAYGASSGADTLLGVALALASLFTPTDEGHT